MEHPSDRGQNAAAAWTADPRPNLRSCECNFWLAHIARSHTCSHGRWKDFFQWGAYSGFSRGG